MTAEEFKSVRQILWNFVPIENYGEALAELEAIRALNESVASKGD